MTSAGSFSTSLCHQCVKHRLVETDKGAVFIRCTDPELPKYQSQPIIACARFAAATHDD